jgi:hypothetical protein
MGHLSSVTPLVQRTPMIGQFCGELLSRLNARKAVGPIIYLGFRYVLNLCEFIAVLFML